MTEPVARLLKEKYPDKAEFEKALVETARRPLYERTFANYFANPGSRIDEDRYPFSRYEKRIQRTEDARLTEIPVWYALPDGCSSDKMLTIPVMKQGMTAILLTGDSARNKVQVMPGGGYSTIRIDLPDDWDRLMAEKGYAPLSEFFYSPH
ncbi:MAG: hypothetical protein K2O56_06435 [Muribaculaceae bacterium]|nr:hypothetical protein [Muribaculaceae bacterium]